MIAVKMCHQDGIDVCRINAQGLELVSHAFIPSNHRFTGKPETES